MGDDSMRKFNDARTKFLEREGRRTASTTGTGRWRKMSLTVKQLCHLPRTMRFQKPARLHAPRS
jgi:hypothetical protein